MVARASSSAPAYRKLTRLHRTVGLLSQLWLGPDHLLHVQSTGYTESYRRFYLRDIQCLLIVHTGRRTYLALTLLVLLLIVAAIMAGVGSGGVGYAILVGAFLPFFLWNHLLGPGCRVVVVTAVHQESIPALSRLPRTRRIVAELTALIEAAQADLAAGPPPDAPVVEGGTTPPLPPPLPPLPTS